MNRVIFEHGLSSQEARSVKQHCVLNDIPYTTRSPGALPIGPLHALGKGDMPVGSVEFVKAVLYNLGLKVEFDTYPDNIRPLLGRLIRKVPAYEVFAYPASVFIKPIETKRFTGFVFKGLWDRDRYSDHEKEQLAAFLDYRTGEPLYLSPVINLLAEWRVYVTNGAITAVCRYDDSETEYEAPYELIAKAVSRFPGRTLAIDVGLAKKYGNDGDYLPIVIECNDAWACGKYQGISDAAYYTFLRTRWDEIIGGRI